ncbi:MAG: carbon storage regulator CsrA [Candidatus Eremiobacteraeota bacterium]|nr:carbon storage regulator CsrA [Candidatus Eremiobacteraeota bacterium]
MLVVTRRIDQSVTIGDDIRVVIVGVEGDHVRLGIDAPQKIPVHRTELLSRDRKSDRGGRYQQ